MQSYIIQVLTDSYNVHFYTNYIEDMSGPQSELLKFRRVPCLSVVMRDKK